MGNKENKRILRGRKNVPPAHRQDWMVEVLEKDSSYGFVKMFRIYKDKFGRISERTFNKDWNIARNRYEEVAVKRQKAMERARDQEAVKMARKGLKSKYERLMQYQELVSDCLTDLTAGMTDDTIITRSKPKQYRRKMTVMEYNQTRKTLKDLQSEISKIEGDYADIHTSTDVTVKDEFKGKTLKELKAIEKNYKTKIKKPDNDGGGA